MAVNGVNGAQGSPYANPSATKKESPQLGDGLGRDSFLQLLITQMRYQDPLEPASDTEYIAQLAQFNALEQMQNLNDKFDKMIKWSQMTQASSLIGKQVDGIITEQKDANRDGKPDTTNVTGVVKEVKYKEGEPYLVVGSSEVKLADVTRIYEAPAKPAATAPASTVATTAGSQTASGQKTEGQTANDGAGVTQDFAEGSTSQSTDIQA